MMQLPPISSSQGSSQTLYKVSTLHWDIATSILAVGLTVIMDDANTNGNISQGNDNKNETAMNIVQLYTRNNYRW